MTRRPATHNRTYDFRAQPHATADCLRIIRARCRCLFTDCPCPCLVADMGCSWTRPFARTEHDRGLFADTDSLRSEPVRDRSAYATADWLRIVSVRCRCLFADCPSTCLVADMDSSWTRPFARTDRGRGLFADPDDRVRGLSAASSRLRTDLGHVHNSGKWHGCSAYSPRLFRGHRILSWLRSKASLVKNR